ncbi:CAT RNA binding domain-containing protein, partial [Lactococcus petauri]
MIIKKTMNSNAVLATDDKGIEYILLGKGIGYGKKIGAAVEEDTVNQTFIPLKSSNLKEYMGILEAIPPELLEITREIVSEAERVLDCKLNPSIYFMLGDHLNFAVERFRSNISITNRVFWEIKTYYPK